MSIVRVKPGVSQSTYDADTQSYVTLSAGMEFDSSDPIVKQVPEAFESDADATRPARKRATSVETTSAEPGTKRNR